ncbi:hypothetical protein ACQPZJ_40730 [Actinoplanes sp. CA-054009]
MTAPALVGVVASTRRRAGTDVRDFTVRTAAGESVRYEIRDGSPADALRLNDIVRVTTDRNGGVRVVDVLAGLDGPAVRRLTARTARRNPGWVVYAVAAVLVIVAIAVLLSRG